LTEPSRAVFLSYASQDAEAAQRICEALRAAGVEVWFDQSELRGGDAWDQKIRQQIYNCGLFIAVISAHTEARDEGYFRREWKLAVDRTHDMAEDRAFLVPVVVDGTGERSARVPDSFKRVQWSRLPGGGASPAFVERVRRLLSPEISTGRAAESGLLPGSANVRAHVPASRKSALWATGAVVVLALALAFLVANKFWLSRQAPAAQPATPAIKESAPPATAPAAFNPPQYSIAVLPFVNMSGDKDQEYFSEGLTEELLNSLSRINELQVAARTSSFSFQGEHPDIATVARKLNVASVLEGSVRRSGHTIRVTAQLNSAVTGFHLWSQTYDRDLGDVLKLQTEIANAVAGALKVKLLGDVAAKIELGGTHNPEAFDAYLRASKALSNLQDREGLEVVVALYSEALRYDSDYALAYSGRSIQFEQIGEREFNHEFLSRTEAHARRAKFLSLAEADALRAIALAPTLAEGHLALAYVFQEKLDFIHASEEYGRALLLGPGTARVLRNYGVFAAQMGHPDRGLAATHQAVIIDPLNPASYRGLALAAFYARRYEEVLKAKRDQALIDPNSYQDPLEGRAYYFLGEFEKARAACERVTLPDSGGDICLAMVYDKLGRHVDAAAVLAKVQKERGEAYSFAYADVYAQWGMAAKALEWLETAVRVGDDELRHIKATPFLDPLRNEPRFQAIERALKFPD
jgi:TolB-like protein